MSKPMGVLFGVLTLVAILAIVPSAFAQTSGATVNISAGAGASQNCSQTNNCFDPDVINVAPGTTVEWKNNDKVSHTVTSGNPSDNQTGTIFDSSLIAAGKDFSFTFNNPGTYNYFCQVHPWMTGQVIVGAAAATSSTTSSNTPTAPSTMSNMNMSSGTTMSSTPSSTQSAPTTTSTQSAPTQPSETASTLSPTASTQSTGSTDPSQISGWTAGIAIAAIMSGIGVWTAVRRR